MTNPFMPKIWVPHDYQARGVDRRPRVDISRRKLQTSNPLLRGMVFQKGRADRTRFPVLARSVPCIPIPHRFRSEICIGRIYAGLLG